MVRSPCMAFRIGGAHQVAETLDLLLAAGWRCDFDGRVAYVPFGAGSSGWVFEPDHRWPEIQRELREKARRQESPAVRLRYLDTPFGATFRFLPGNRMRVDLDLDRPRVEGCGTYTDLSWYLARVLVPLEQAGCAVEAVECFDTAPGTASAVAAADAGAADTQPYAEAA